MTRIPTACAWILALSASTLAQNLEITPLVEEGDAVAGVGNVTRIDNISVNDNLDWLIEADTDAANTDADSVLLKNGALYLREGDALAAPAGATLDTFDTINLNDAEHSGWNLFLDGTTGTNDDSGMYFDTSLLIQEGTVSTAAGFSPGTPYIGFFEAKINNLNDVLFIASLDDPAISSTVDQALVLLDLDAGGALLSETVVAKEGDLLPGQVSPITTFGTGPHNFAFNDAGDAMFFADLASGEDVIYYNGTLIAQNGQPSPVAGVNWLSLGTPELSINDVGGYAFSGRLDTGSTADDFVLIANGSVLVREGDSLPDIAPFSITSFGSGPVAIDNQGHVLWYGDWDDPDTTVDTGLFLDDELIVQEGVTQVGGVAIDTLRGIQDGYTLSRNGRFIVFEAILADGTEGAYLLTEESSITTITGCTPNAGVLAAASGDGSIGAAIDFQMDNGQANPSFPALSFSLNPAPGFPPCGVMLPGIGELLIGFVPPDPILDLFGPLWTGSAVSLPLFVPPDASLVGVHLWAQGAFFDFTGATAEMFRLTNGLEVVLGL